MRINIDELNEGELIELNHMKKDPIKKDDREFAKVISEWKEL